MGLRETDTALSSGTGFVYEKNHNFYLVTNWHNVSGKNPFTGEYLSKKTSAMPDMLSTMFRVKEMPASCKREHILLYEDNRMMKPKWLEHPEFGHKVDVVVLPISEDIISKFTLFPINKISFDTQYKEEVGDDAFVIGYPFSEVTYLQMPIWKRASIASEPDINLDQTPKMLIDTATRPGLSGSPVIMQRVGIHGLENGQAVDSSIIGRIRKFIGIYSGRIGDDELKAQLGIVWKARVVDEIIDGNTIGKPPTQT
jgi:hypothetical protein